MERQPCAEAMPEKAARGKRDTSWLPGPPKVQDPRVPPAATTGIWVRQPSVQGSSGQRLQGRDAADGSARPPHSAECFMSESTNGMAAPGCRGNPASGGVALAPGRGRGGAYISGRWAAGGAWGRWLLGGRGAGRGARAGGSERAEAPGTRFTRWGDLWAEAV